MRERCSQARLYTVRTMKAQQVLFSRSKRVAPACNHVRRFFVTCRVNVYPVILDQLRQLEVSTWARLVPRHRCSGCRNSRESSYGRVQQRHYRYPINLYTPPYSEERSNRTFSYVTSTTVFIDYRKLSFIIYYLFPKKILNPPQDKGR